VECGLERAYRVTAEAAEGFAAADVADKLEALMGGVDSLTVFAGG